MNALRTRKLTASLAVTALLAGGAVTYQASRAEPHSVYSQLAGRGEISPQHHKKKHKKRCKPKGAYGKPKVKKDCRRKPRRKN